MDYMEVSEQLIRPAQYLTGRNLADTSHTIMGIWPIRPETQKNPRGIFVLISAVVIDDIRPTQMERHMQ